VKFFEPMVSVVDALSGLLWMAAVLCSCVVAVEPPPPEPSSSSSPQATRPSARTSAATAADAARMMRAGVMGLL
jgi:hypothetical protein